MCDIGLFVDSGDASLTTWAVARGTTGDTGGNAHSGDHLRVQKHSMYSLVQWNLGLHLG